MSTLELDVLSTAPAEETKEKQTEKPRATSPVAFGVTGTLIGFKDEGCTALILFPGQDGTAAVPAASVIDVQGTDIGRQVVLIFENGDRRRPIIIGLLKGVPAWPFRELPGQIEADADGERVIISAKEQLILRCGKASITLTKAGKVLIQGAYVSSRSSGVMRIKGGSVQIN